MILKVYLFSLLVFISNGLFAQESDREGNFFAAGISYGMNVPAGDLADRFGQSYSAGISLDWFNEKLNGSYGIEYYLAFGDNVKEDVVEPLRLENGRILGFDGRYADVFLRQRGQYAGMYIKKIIIPLTSNPRAGVALSVGAGVMQHKIRIQVDTNNAPHLEGSYGAGYDRQTFGPALTQSLSYTHVGRSKTVNFAVSFMAMEGFTTNRRPVNFDTGMPSDGTRTDISLGLQLKWYIPLRDTREPEEIYY